MTTERKKELAAIAATLPTSSDELYEVARSELLAFHRCIVNEDEAGSTIASARCDAAIFALNGFDTCGTYADEDSPGNEVARRNAAEPGAIPGWGQEGIFLIQHKGLRAVVSSRLFTGRIPHFQFYAVDADAPFISETGYRSHFQQPVFGCTVDEIAKAVFQTLLTEKQTYIDQERREYLQTFSWLEGSGSSCYEDTNGQLAMLF